MDQISASMCQLGPPRPPGAACRQRRRACASHGAWPPGASCPRPACVRGRRSLAARAGSGERDHVECRFKRRLPPRFSRCLSVRPEVAGIGAVPLAEAKAAGVGNRRTSPTSPRIRAAVMVLTATIVVSVVGREPTSNPRRCRRSRSSSSSSRSRAIRRRSSSARVDASAARRSSARAIDGRGVERRNGARTRWIRLQRASVRLRDPRGCSRWRRHRVCRQQRRRPRRTYSRPLRVAPRRRQRSRPFPYLNAVC